jgi:hypothetical protein
MLLSIRVIRFVSKGHKVDCSSAFELVRVVCFDDKPLFKDLFNLNSSGGIKIILGGYWAPSEGKIVIQEHTKLQISTDGLSTNELTPSSEVNQDPRGRHSEQYPRDAFGNSKGKN